MTSCLQQNLAFIMLLYVIILSSMASYPRFAAATTADKSDELGINGDVLDAIRDSGVLENWQEKLDQMLFEEEVDKEIRSEKAEELKKNLKCNKERDAAIEKVDETMRVLNPFINAYVAENEKSVSPIMIGKTVERLIYSKDFQVSKLMVQLGPFIDAVETFVKKDASAEERINSHLAGNKNLTLPQLTVIVREMVVRKMHPGKGDATGVETKKGKKVKRDLRKPLKDAGIGDILNLGSQLFGNGHEKDMMGILGDILKDEKKAMDIGSVMKMATMFSSEGKDGEKDDAIFKIARRFIESQRSEKEKKKKKKASPPRSGEGPDLQSVLSIASTLMNGDSSKVGGGFDLGSAMKYAGMMFGAGNGESMDWSQSWKMLQMSLLGTDSYGLEDWIHILKGSSGGFDFERMAQMLSLYAGIPLEGASQGNPWLTIGKHYVMEALKSESTKNFFSTLHEYYNVFVKSESGQRLFKAIPKLMASTESDEFFDILAVEAGWNWQKFFDGMGNPDYRDQLTVLLANQTVEIYKYFKDPPEGSLASKAPMLINTFLASYNFPPFNKREPLASAKLICKKFTKEFTDWKFDCDHHVGLWSDMYDEAFSDLSFKPSEMTYEELAKKIALIYGQDVVGPMHEVWQVYEFLFDRPKCSEHLLCILNNPRYFKGAFSKVKIGIIKGSSIAAAWALSSNKQSDPKHYWNLYRAIWRGVAKEDCAANYSVDKSCYFFDWQKDSYMKLDFDHVEL